MVVKIPLQNAFFLWLEENYVNFILSLVYVGLAFLFYRLFSRQLSRLEEKERISSKLVDNLKSLLKWLLIILIFSLILGQFGATTDWIGSVLSLFSGTILGFAAINTIGNAIAGLIVRRVKPL